MTDVELYQPVKRSRKMKSLNSVYVNYLSSYQKALIILQNLPLELSLPIYQHSLLNSTNYDILKMIDLVSKDDVTDYVIGNWITENCLFNILSFKLEVIHCTSKSERTEIERLFNFAQCDIPIINEAKGRTLNYDSSYYIKLFNFIQSRQLRININSIIRTLPLLVDIHSLTPALTTTISFDMVPISSINPLMFPCEGCKLTKMMCPDTDVALVISSCSAANKDSGYITDTGISDSVSKMIDCFILPSQGNSTITLQLGLVDLQFKFTNFPDFTNIWKNNKVEFTNIGNQTLLLDLKNFDFSNLEKIGVLWRQSRGLFVSDIIGHVNLNDVPCWIKEFSVKTDCGYYSSHKVVVPKITKHMKVCGLIEDDTLVTLGGLSS